MRYVLPLEVIAVVFISLAMRPTLKSWRLTGGHRIVAGLQSRAHMVEVG